MPLACSLREESHTFLRTLLTVLGILLWRQGMCVESLKAAVAVLHATLAFARARLPGSHSVLLSCVSHRPRNSAEASPVFYVHLLHERFLFFMLELRGLTFYSRSFIRPCCAESRLLSLIMFRPGACVGRAVFVVLLDKRRLT